MNSPRTCCPELADVAARKMNCSSRFSVPHPSIVVGGRTHSTARLHREPVGNGARLVDGRSHQTVTEPDPIPVDSEETCLTAGWRSPTTADSAPAAAAAANSLPSGTSLPRAAASSNRRVGAGRSDIRAVNDATISSPTGIQSGIGPG